MQIDQQRLRKDIEETAKFGSVECGCARGRSAMTATKANKQARDYLVEQMNEAGLEVAIDAIGNIEGRFFPKGVDRNISPVVAGSHLDSVPRGGIFDGPLGVYAALEAIRTIQEVDASLNRPLSVVSFTGEEGARFKNGLLGSSVVTGARSLSETLQFTDNNGVTVEEALRSIGYLGNDEIAPTLWNAWLELHIEQNTTLERNDNLVGVVDSIAGMANCRVEIEGEADHAGATPMNERTDALAAASEFILAVESAAKKVVENESETAVCTIGELHIMPNAKNVIAGSTKMIIDIRDINYSAMKTIIGNAKTCLNRLGEQRNVSTSFSLYRDQPPIHMADRCIEAAIKAAESRNIPRQVMHSASMHDTAHVAKVTDTVLLFAPSRDGISHNPQEWTDWKDCTEATNVLTQTIHSLATK